MYLSIDSDKSGDSDIDRDSVGTSTYGKLFSAMTILCYQIMNVRSALFKIKHRISLRGFFFSFSETICFSLSLIPH